MNYRMILIIILAFANSYIISAQKIESGDKIKSDTTVLITAYNIRPQLLSKGTIQSDLDIKFPRFYKYYNSMTAKTEKKLSVSVLNEAYFTGSLTLGISNRYNLYISLPYVDIHHYFPVIFQSGVGLGDMQLGVLYKPKKHFNEKLFGNYIFEGRLTIPTGEYSNLEQSDYPTGNGAFGLMLAINSKKKINELFKLKDLNLIYSVYYDLRINAYGNHTGDETSVYCIIQKPVNTEYGSFGLESGVYAYYNMPDKKNKQTVPNSGDYSLDLMVGGWYKFMDKYYIRVNIPYSIYENNAFLTKYQVLLKLSYIFN